MMGESSCLMNEFMNETPRLLGLEQDQARSGGTVLRKIMANKKAYDLSSSISAAFNILRHSALSNAGSSATSLISHETLRFYLCLDLI